MKNLTQEDAQRVMREVAFSDEKGAPELGPKMVKLVAEVFSGPDSASEFFNTLRQHLENSGNNKADIEAQYEELMRSLREKGRTKAISLLNTLVDQYQNYAPGLDRTSLRYELFTSSILTDKLHDHWPKVRK